MISGVFYWLQLSFNEQQCSKYQKRRDYGTPILFAAIDRIDHHSASAC
jgi:hypothetical protein